MAENIRLHGYDVFAVANCVDMGRAVLLHQPGTFGLVWQLNPEDEEAPLIESWQYEPVLGAETRAYWEALKSMIALASRR